MSELHLRGMTWNHTRGYAPLEAAARTYTERHPSVHIAWERRSLKDFEDFPITRLAADYDLIVIDHPFVGYAAANGPLLALDRFIPGQFLVDQAAHSVGASHASYDFGGHHWALAIDSAAPVACWREDLLRAHGSLVPKTWEDVLVLARLGLVEVPAAPINCLMDFFCLCLAHGGVPCDGPELVVDRPIGIAALDSLRELLSLCDKGVWARNPINSLDLLASSNNTKVAYCLFPYGYSNYSRPGYAAHPLEFGDVPTFRGDPLVTVLGGTGLAVSALRSNRAAALDFAQFCASRETQTTLYTRSGGQPGYRTAWADPENNRISNGYFEKTLPTLDRAWLRPRHPGYLEFQEKAGPVVHAALQGDLSDEAALSHIDGLHRASLASPSLHT